MKRCEQCGKEIIGEICTCTQSKAKDKKNSKQWLIILFLISVLCVLSFIYMQSTKLKPCKEEVGGVFYPQGCSFDGKHVEPNYKNDTETNKKSNVSNIFDPKTNQPIMIDDVGE